MEDHNLSQFDGLNRGETVTRLLAQGYTEIGNTECGLYLAHPDRPLSMLRLTPHNEACDHFVALCRNHPDNPYFPRLGDCRAFTDEPGFFITTMERLENVRDRTDPTRGPLVGTARALTLLLEGDEDHATVYEFMMQNPMLRAAVQAIAQTITHSIVTAENSCLHYQSGMNRTLPLTEQETNHILFRTAQRGAQPVFTAPFRIASITCESERAALLQYTHTLCARAHLPPAAPPCGNAPTTTPPHA